MLHTRLCDLLEIEHPVVLGGMGSSTSASLVAAVSNGGGFGTLGTSGASGAQITETVKAIRAATDKPFGINHLLFRIDEDAYAATLKARPSLAAFAWARKDQDLRTYFRRAHDAGLKVMHMAGEVPEAAARRGGRGRTSSWRKAWKAAATSAGWQRFPWCRWW
jgi:NAD(P)H-dependent flavin oxidoreductase YrpB (nitropropane dioxygenase family)